MRQYFTAKQPKAKCTPAIRADQLEPARAADKQQSFEDFKYNLSVDNHFAK